MRLFHNDDTGVFFKNCDKDHLLPNEETMREYVRSFKDSGITDLVFCIGSHLLSNVPSNVWDFIGEKREQLKLSLLSGFVIEKSYKEYHADYFKTLSDEARKCNIRPWISIRMNDVHNNRRANTIHAHSTIQNKAWDERKNRTGYREISSYFDDALDYSYPDIYKLHLDYVKEQIEKNDADGVELDFMREGLLYAPGCEEEGRAITRRFVKEVKDTILQFEEVRGHRIELAIRTFATPNSDYRSGIDAIGLAREGYIDVVIACSRYGCCDDSIPVEIWKRLLPENVLFSVNLEAEIRCYHYIDNHFVACTNEIRRGLSHAFISEGADSLYFFNVAYDPGYMQIDKKEYYLPIFDEKMRKESKKSYVVGYNDFPAPGEHDENLRLPVILRNDILNYGRYTDIRVYVGENDTPLYLLLGINATKEEITVFINTTKPEYVGETHIDPGFASERVLVYKVCPMKGNIRCVEVKSNENRDPEIILNYVSMQNYPPNLL